MSGRTRRRGTTTRLLIGLLAATTCLAARPAYPGDHLLGVPDRPREATDANAAAPPVEQPGAASGGAPGMIIHIDPKTGAILKAPAPGSVPLPMTPGLQNALSTSHQGLMEVPGPVPGGGVKLDLQGRFRSPLVGTVDPDGNVTIQHLRETPGSDDTK
jgi:hypothetical protein